jgi:hypothetical protein
VGLLFVWTPPIHAEESPAFEKIRNVSPDGKFAVRVSCSSEAEDPDDIDSNLITAVDLVSLPSKNAVMNIGQNGEGRAPDVIWCKDSEWFAFPLSEGGRVINTHVYHRSGDDFSRNEYIKPVRWIKPDVLLLEQFDIFRGWTAEDATYQFTAKFDE